MTSNNNSGVGGENGLSSRSLFGGAFTCSLPTNALDTSQFREVPDNQEVFCHEKTDQSIMFDILEYQPQVQGEQAIKYHYADIADFNDAMEDAEVSSVEVISKDVLSMTECTEAWYLFGRQMISKFKEAADAKNLVHVLIMLYRLPQHETDMLVIMNDPIAISTKSSISTNNSNLNDASKWTESIFKQVACTLKIVDKSIFG